MVSVVAADGSVPRGPGSRMVVTAGTFSGSIGGGRLEFLALAQARKILDHAPGSWRLQDYPLGPLLGQCCGGKVRLLVERLDPARADWLAKAGKGGMLVTSLEGDRIERSLAEGLAPTGTSTRDNPLADEGWLVEALDTPPRPVLLFGAGHIGQAIMHASNGLPLATSWIDTRRELDNGALIASEEEAEILALDASEESCVLILTHDHGLDYRLVRAALRGRAGFVGLIGSATKRARFCSRLAKEGVDTSRLTCPIGVPDITGKQPAVIAIAVLAQLLALEPQQ